ncbi:MAG: cell division protein SepF [Clostridia bacterium]|nr:cell division protein SepF [Clostridia bacterium]
MGIFSRFFNRYTEDDFEEEEIEEKIEDGASIALGGTNIELKVIKPTEFEQILVAADSLLEGKTVLLNLEGLDRAICRRMIDFISGVAYALNSNIKKATKDSYFITPRDVDVSGEAFENPTDDGDTFSDI